MTPAASDEESITGLIEAADVLARAEGGLRRALDNKPKSGWRRWFAVDDSAAIGAVLEGIQLGRRRLDRVLARHGVEPIPAAGRQFDPETMEAIEAVAHSGQPSGTVLEEVRVGYDRDGSVFRSAQVKVAR
jgi:molecular chaperone GrpE